MLLSLLVALSMLLAAPVAAQQYTATAAVRIHLAVETGATSARGAIAANDLARVRVLRVLATTGVAAEEVEEIGLELLPEYAPREIVPARTVRGTQPRIVGYVVGGASPWLREMPRTPRW
ncbi:MAG TPA: hypothetical protein VGR27_14515 [Longimicrobiaceae bacterium]|nr:hypothetical protein [Longimicrobiaceae bacterium]